MNEYEIRWLVNDKVLLLKMEGRIDLDLMMQVGTEMTQLMDNSRHNSIHILVYDQQAS